MISPLVRKQARDAGLDLTSLTGTGPAGVVSRQDVRRAIAERAARQRPALPAAPDAGTGIEALADDTERRIPLRGARRAAAEQASPARAGRSPRPPSGSTSTPPPWSRRGAS